MKIIIVEDEVRIREGVHRLLTKMNDNYDVIGEAENGLEGLKLIRENMPDLVIADVRMPIMDGLEMIKKLKEDKIRCKFIILSAYSEFQYAQEAVKLGVSEYLLKPVSVGAFTQTLKNIEEQFDREKKTDLDSIGSIQSVFSGLLFDSLRADKNIRDYLETKFNINDEIHIVEISVYLGKNYESEQEKAKKELIGIIEERGGFSYCVLEVPKERMLLILIYGYEGFQNLERWFQNRILRHERTGKFHMYYGWIEVIGMKNIREGFQVLLKYQEWNLVLGGEVIISYPKITKVQTVPCSYPIEIENKLKISLCEFDMKQTEKLFHQFENHFRDGKIYDPREVKESFVRFIWSIIGIANEIDAIDYKGLEQQKILENIMGAISYSELIDILGDLIENLRMSAIDKKVGMSLPVKRTQSIIHEFYQSGITLDEIASKLNITPEYLGTQLKLYEIAQLVGYTDAKYFSRVFRECTGQLPAEYRKTYK